jgi:hypothetical protein
MTMGDAMLTNLQLNKINTNMCRLEHGFEEQFFPPFETKKRNHVCCDFPISEGRKLSRRRERFVQEAWSKYDILPWRLLFL